MHNTFDLNPSGNKWVAQSHNFTDCVGEGKTKEEAIQKMNQKIIYFKDNFPKQFKQNIKNRLKNNLECLCGHPLTETPLGFRKE